MNQELITQLNQSFNQISHTWEDSGIEYWLARDLQELLEYSEWRNFLKVIEKAKEACENSGGKVDNHFVAVNKMVVIGSGAERPIDDIMLTRYACYLIAQNGDPRKDAIAFAQTYFALQTRKHEKSLESQKPSSLRIFTSAVLTIKASAAFVRVVMLHCLAAIPPKA